MLKRGKVNVRIVENVDTTDIRCVSRRTSVCHRAPEPTQSQVQQSGNETTSGGIRPTETSLLNRIIIGYLFSPPHLSVQTINAASDKIRVRDLQIVTRCAGDGAGDCVFLINTLVT